MAEKKSKEKEFGISSWSLRNRTTVMFLSFILLVFGITAYQNSAKEAFPEIAIPTIYVGTAYPGYSPLDVEEDITKPIEKEIKSITGIDNVKSVSVPGYSTIVIEFEQDVNVNVALQDVKDAVDKAKSELPLDDLPSDPNVFELNFAEFPIMNINLSGNYSLDKLKEYGEYLEDELEGLAEVSKVDIRGVTEKELKVELNRFKMEAMQVSFDDVSNAIANENASVSMGEVNINGFRRSMRVDGKFREPRELLDIIVKSEDSKEIRLRDVADTVAFEFKERESYARLNGKPVVMVDVVKRSGSNQLDAAAKAYAIVEKAREEIFPADLEIAYTNDTSIDIKNNISNLENSIISGVILVVLVLMFFMGSRNASFVGVAIPLSMFISFVVLGAMGITINMMVQYALIMALGMLVDNAIVVIENTYRLMDEEGLTAIQAARRGVAEVAWPIIASTATTLAAFIPLAMWPGIMGEFMQYLPITLIIVLSSSLFVGLVVNPVLAGIFMKTGAPTRWSKKRLLIVCGVLVLLGFAAYLFWFIALIILLNYFVLSKIAEWFQGKGMPRLENFYRGFLSGALSRRKPYVYFFGTILGLILVMMLFSVFTPKVLFFPETEPKYVNIYIEQKLGTDIEETNKFTLEMEDKLNGWLSDRSGIVESMIANVGVGTTDPNDPSSLSNEVTPHKARIVVDFHEYQQRIIDGEYVSSREAMKMIQDSIRHMAHPGVVMTVEPDPVGPPAGKPINIEVTGEDYETLNKLAHEIKAKIDKENIAGIEELQIDLQTDRPQLLVEVDRVKAGRLGLNTRQVAFALRTALFGREASEFKLPEDDYDIEVRLSDNQRYNVETLKNLRITFRDPATGKIVQVPVSAVANIRKNQSYGQVKRIDNERVVTVYSNVLEGFNPTEINVKLKALLANHEMPKGYTFAFTGEQEKQAEEMAFLSGALMLALFLILLIIVAQFNRISSPFIILSAVLLSLIGVFLGLVIFQMEFIVIMTMIGIISLAGIVVNNAIVLIDYTMLLQARKLEELVDEGRTKLTLAELTDCVVEAGSKRLRPVLLTAITTVLGLVPLAIGLNIDFFGLLSDLKPNVYIGGDSTAFWSPMSWTIIFGLTFATFLTLVIVPVMYIINERLRFWVSKQIAKLKASGDSKETLSN